MKSKEIYTIKINDISKSQETVLECCNKIVYQFKKNPQTELSLNFLNCSFIYPDYSVLILSTLKHLESKGYLITGKVIYSESAIIQYLSRINFFKYLKIKIPERYKRLDSNAFVEIQNYNEDNQLKVLNSIMTVIKKNSLINDNVFASLDYCLNEILDNVLNHSKRNEGWVVAQYFEKLNSIRLIVCDTGVGIYNSLKRKYKYSEVQAIQNCIVEGISNGDGQGHGLYATSSFVRLNKGWLSLISGNKKLDVSEKKNLITNIPYWQGTCVYLRVNTNIDVDYKQFTSTNYDYKKQLFEDLFE